MTPEKCTRCGIGVVRNVSAKTVYTDTRSGVTVPYLDAFRRCAGCGEEFYTRDQSMARSYAITAALRKRLGFMAPEEIKRVRKACRLTPNGLDKALGVRKGLTRAWERGTVPPDALQSKLLWIAANERPTFRKMAKAFTKKRMGN